MPTYLSAKSVDSLYGMISNSESNNSDNYQQKINKLKKNGLLPNDNEIYYENKIDSNNNHKSLLLPDEVSSDTRQDNDDDDEYDDNEFNTFFVDGKYSHNLILVPTKRVPNGAFKTSTSDIVSYYDVNTGKLLQKQFRDSENAHLFSFDLKYSSIFTNSTGAALSGKYSFKKNICTAMLNGYSHEYGSLINNKAKIIKTENGYTIVSTVKDKKYDDDDIVVLISKYVRLTA
jgi:hypothetical protein